nr:immunoglobulin heavy chain junction region [Mus musculus]
CAEERSLYFDYW